MSYSAADTIRIMRVMRGQTGHWREGGFGTDVIVALCAQSSSDEDAHIPAFERFEQLGVSMMNTLLVWATYVVV